MPSGFISRKSTQAGVPFYAAKDALIPTPTPENNYLGFCKSAWRLQNGDRQGAVEVRKESATWSRNAVRLTYGKANHLGCKQFKCAFRSDLVSSSVDLIWDLVFTFPERGIKIRWSFLAMSHVPQRVASKDHSPFKCLFCAYLGLGASAGVYGNMEYYLDHIQAEHGCQVMPDVIAYKTGCIHGRVADDAENFDINIWPVTHPSPGNTQRWLSDSLLNTPVDALCQPKHKSIDHHTLSVVDLKLSQFIAEMEEGLASARDSASLAPKDALPAKNATDRLVRYSYASSKYTYATREDDPRSICDEKRLTTDLQYSPVLRPDTPDSAESTKPPIPARSARRQASHADLARVCSSFHSPDEVSGGPPPYSQLTTATTTTTLTTDRCLGDEAERMPEDAQYGVMICINAISEQSPECVQDPDEILNDSALHSPTTTMRQSGDNARETLLNDSQNAVLMCLNAITEQLRQCRVILKAISSSLAVTSTNSFRLLDESLQEAPKDIMKEHQRGVLRFGTEFNTGDHVAIRALQQLAIQLSSSLRNKLHQMALGLLVPNFDQLLDAVDTSRNKAIASLGGLKRRLAQNSGGTGHTPTPSWQGLSARSSIDHGLWSASNTPKASQARPLQLANGQVEDRPPDSSELPQDWGYLPRYSSKRMGSNSLKHGKSSSTNTPMASPKSSSAKPYSRKGSQARITQLARDEEPQRRRSASSEIFRDPSMLPRFCQSPRSGSSTPRRLEKRPSGDVRMADIRDESPPPTPAPNTIFTNQRFSLTETDLLRMCAAAPSPLKNTITLKHETSVTTETEVPDVATDAAPSSSASPKSQHAITHSTSSASSNDASRTSNGGRSVSSELRRRTSVLKDAFRNKRKRSSDLESGKPRDVNRDLNHLTHMLKSRLGAEVKRVEEKEPIPKESSPPKTAVKPSNTKYDTLPWKRTARVKKFLELVAMD